MYSGKDRPEIQIPTDLRPDIIQSAEWALARFRESGWYVSAIQWEDRTVGMLGFSAKRNSLGIYVMCNEFDLTARLNFLAESQESSQE